MVGQVLFLSNRFVPAWKQVLGGLGWGKGELACRPLFQAHALVQCQYIHVRYRACLVPVLEWYGHPHSKTLVRIWASPSHITLAIRVRVRVTGDAHIVIVPAQSIPVSDYIGCNIKPLTSFHFPLLDFIWTVLIFILFYFEWRDTENKQYLAIRNHGFSMGINHYAVHIRMADLLIFVQNRSFFITRRDSTEPLTCNTIRSVGLRENLKVLIQQIYL